MSAIADGPEAQNELFKSNRSLAEKNSSLLRGDLPEHLKRSSHRLQFPPSYALVGVYRLCTDQNLYVPVWQKCQHGTVRGAAVGIVWVSVCSFETMTWLIMCKPGVLHLWNPKEIYRDFPCQVSSKLTNAWLCQVLCIEPSCSSPKVTGLATDTIFGYPVPFNVHTCASRATFALSRSFCNFISKDAAVLLVGQQITYILRFFLSRNIRIARDRAWNQTVASRGKGEDFWQPYTEEWDQPPKSVHSAMWYEQAFSSWALFMFKKGEYEVYRLCCR